MRRSDNKAINCTGGSSELLVVIPICGHTSVPLFANCPVWQKKSISRAQINTFPFANCRAMANYCKQAEKLSRTIKNKHVKFTDSPVFSSYSKVTIELCLEGSFKCPKGDLEELSKIYWNICSHRLQNILFVQGLHNSPIYDACKPQSASVFALM